MKNALHIFSRVVLGTLLASITAAIFIAAWLAEPEDVDKVFAIFAK